jgi:hypothetical protein
MRIAPPLFPMNPNEFLSGLRHSKGVFIHPAIYKINIQLASGIAKQIVFFRLFALSRKKRGLFLAPSLMGGRNRHPAVYDTHNFKILCFQYAEWFSGLILSCLQAPLEIGPA